MDKNKRLEFLFNSKKNLVKELNCVGSELDKLIREKWGFHYSETDDDFIIDTLDYGTSGINFETFKNKMNQYKQNSDENDGNFGVVH